MKPEHTCIVIVEDQPEILQLVRDVLAITGYESVGFNRPFDPTTLDVVPHAFILDMMLPDRSGIELAGMLREGGYEQVPMIAMSASPDKITEAKKSGLFQGYLPKPFDLDELLSLIEEQLVA
jgi:two-component system phosphate regulon response regulator PhoB